MPRGNPKPKKTFAERLASYKTYDPAKEGFGNVNDWKFAWDRVMGHEEALGILGDASPLTVMGFDSMPSATELKKRYRELMLLNHPDKGGSEEQCKQVIAAYSELKSKVA